MRFITYFPLFLLFISCNERGIPFDKNEWNKQVDGFYLNRDLMVDDLIENHLENEMKYSELINLIGTHENYVNMHPLTIGYELKVDYGMNIDPIETKKLIIELSKDSTVNKIRIVSIKN